MNHPFGGDRHSLSLIKFVIAQLPRRRGRAESLPPLGPRSSTHVHIDSIFRIIRYHRPSLEPPRQPNVLSMEDEKTLEDIDCPLRHFFLASDDHEGSDLLLPAPAPSIRDQIIQIDFEFPLHRTIALSLSVDPGPGCGGIAWPAGEVRSLPPCVPDVAYFCQSFCTIYHYRPGLSSNVRRL